MNDADRRLLVWLVASLVGACVLVGLVRVSDPPRRASGSVALATCDLGEGRQGRVYDGLCLDAPPFGYVARAAD